MIEREYSEITARVIQYAQNIGRDFERMASVPYILNEEDWRTIAEQFSDDEIGTALDEVSVYLSRLSAFANAAI